MISEKTIEDTIYQLYKKAAIELGEDVKSALEDALKREDDDLGKLINSDVPGYRSSHYFCKTWQCSS